jgi:hypothetical protein
MPEGPQDLEEIEIVRLGRAQEPTDEEGWILVENAVSGPILRKCVGKGNAAMVAIQGPFAATHDAFETARRQALGLGMPIIYAKGFPHA